MQAPSVFDYLNYRDFLGDWFTWKKQENANYSHRVFARLAGIAPGTLNNVVQGRRVPTPETTDAFGRAMELDDAESEALLMLVDLERAPTLSARAALIERILARPRSGLRHKLDADYLRFVSRWYYPAVRELARLPGFRDDPAWIARTLMPSISVEQAEEALRLLVELRFLVRDEDGVLQVQKLRVETPPDRLGVQAWRYHSALLELSANALDEVPSEQRYFGATLLTVPETAIPVLREAVEQFLRDTMNLVDQEREAPTRVVQLSATVFPVSRGTND